MFITFKLHPKLCLLTNICCTLLDIWPVFSFIFISLFFSIPNHLTLPLLFSLTKQVTKTATKHNSIKNKNFKTFASSVLTGCLLLSMIIILNAPPSTCSQVLPCIWLWYQWVPPMCWLAGKSMPYTNMLSEPFTNRWLLSPLPYTLLCNLCRCKLVSSLPPFKKRLCFIPRFRRIIGPGYVYWTLLPDTRYRTLWCDRCQYPLQLLLLSHQK